MIWSISFHLNILELNFNGQNACRSISKVTVFVINFRRSSSCHFDACYESEYVIRLQELFSFCSDTFCKKSRPVETRNLNIILSLSFQNETFKEKTTTHYQTVSNLQSDHLKNCKFYENLSKYANFSTSSGKGHKTKGQFL